MIKLDRIALPDVVATLLAGWQAELQTRLDRGDDVQDIDDYVDNHYKDPRLKDILKRESHGKCIYCEAKILHAQFGDVEHIKPKRRFRDISLSHDNLGLCCTACNNSKKDRWDAAVPFLNPYTDQPNQFLRAFGPMLGPLPHALRATETIRVLGLNRVGLLERRAEHLGRFRALLDAYHSVIDPLAKQIAHEEMKVAIQKEGEYSCVLRWFLEDNQVQFA
jgi:5-methylcytosine-specific restriction endonuclease McrA